MSPSGPAPTAAVSGTVPPAAPHRAASALALLLTAGALFGVMAWLAKLATARLPGSQVAFLRFAIGLAGVAVAGVTVIRLRPVNHRGLVLRGLFGGLAVLLFFTSIAHLPVGTATLLTYTAPVFTAVDSAVFLGERVSRGTLVALALTLLGVVLVVMGGAAPGAPGFAGFGLWELCGLASAMLSGAAVTAVRAARRTDGPWEIFGAFCLFGVVATGPVAAHAWVQPTGREWALLAGVGLVALVAQVLFSSALGHIRAATSGAISQVTPITALVLGAVVEHDPVGAVALGGSAITVGGVGLAAWTAARDAERERAAAVAATAATAPRPPPVALSV